MTEATTPRFHISEKQARQNIATMAAKFKGTDISFRPHFKTHQAEEIGQWFRDLRIKQITVSSVSMAEYFASHGWDDITIAFPANVLEIDKINRLAAEIRLGLLFTCSEDAAFWERSLTSPVDGWIEIDTGYNRSGIKYNDFAEIISLSRSLEASDLISFKGILTHAGNTYGAKDKGEILNLFNESCERMLEIKHEFQVTGIDPVPLISVGDTPGCTVVEKFRGIDEARPGNFVFYDVMQAAINEDVLEQISCALSCPVVQKKEKENQLVIYGGGVHFSKETVVFRGKKCFGIMAEVAHGRFIPRPEWGYLSSLSQEHGIIQLEDKALADFKTGNLVCIIPVHSCLAGEMFREYHTLDGRILPRFVK